MRVGAGCSAASAAWRGGRSAARALAERWRREEARRLPLLTPRASPPSRQATPAGPGRRGLPAGGRRPGRPDDSASLRRGGGALSLAACAAPQHSPLGAGGDSVRGLVAQVG